MRVEEVDSCLKVKKRIVIFTKKTFNYLMLPFGHIGVTLGLFFVVGLFLPGLKTIIDLRYLAIGAILPDLIDKPPGMVIFASIITTGRMIGHTFLFSFLLFLVGLYSYGKQRDIIILSLSIGSLFHLIEDQLWRVPKILFWVFKKICVSKKILLFLLIKKN